MKKILLILKIYVCIGLVVAIWKLISYHSMANSFEWGIPFEVLTFIEHIILWPLVFIVQ